MTLACTTSELTDRGGREINEDATGTREAARAACWVVCDGLGGHYGGEVASRAAADAILAAFDTRPECSEAALQSYLAAADAAVIDTQRRDSALEMMRTTAVLLVSDYQTAAWAHVGDSRLYHFRNGRIVAQTRDHSVPGVFAATGQISPDEIRHHVDRSRLLRSIGERADLKPAIAPPVALTDGDAFLLCTDGFWEYVLEAEMEADLGASRSADEWLGGMRRRLLERIDGSHDNFTAVAVRFGDRTRVDPSAPVPDISQTRYPTPQPAEAAAVDVSGTDRAGAQGPVLSDTARPPAAAAGPPRSRVRTAALVTAIVLALVACALAAVWLYGPTVRDLLRPTSAPGAVDGPLPASGTLSPAAAPAGQTSTHLPPAASVDGGRTSEPGEGGQKLAPVKPTRDGSR